MMRKSVATLFALGFMLMALNAFATTYTDTINFDSGTVLSGQGIFTWSHPVTSDFQIPFDTVNSASLVITARRAADSNDIVSAIEFGVLGPLLSNGNSPKETTFNLDELGLFSAQWTTGSPLNLSLAYNAGTNPNDTLTMVSSVFSLDYNNVAQPSTVPEPGTMMLLGAGFLGLAVYGKRRRNV